MNSGGLSAEWLDRDVRQVGGLPEVIGRTGVVVEIIQSDSISQARIVSEDGSEFMCAVLFLQKMYSKQSHIKFAEEARKAGMKVRYYEGRNLYKGPAVEHSDYQAVIQKVTMPLQWDRMGKTNFIVYPR